MATTLTPRGRTHFGATMVMDYGDYATDGSTTATVNVSGGYVIAIGFCDANQNPLDAGSTPSATLSSKTLSGSVTSYTLTPASGAVTGGTYFVIHGGL